MAVQTQIAYKPSITPLAGRVLQRQCACGQHTSAGGECEHCRQKRGGRLPRAALNPALPHATVGAFAGAKFGHDFSGIPAHFTSDSFTVAAPTAQGIASTGNGRDELAPATKPGECEVGKSESKCVEGVGYMITTIANNCCTRPCTVEHEMQHVRDLDPCCKAYHRARRAPGADQDAIYKTWQTWIEAARPITECRAYSGDLSCAQRLAVLKGCVPAGDDRPSNKEVASADNGSATPSESVSVDDAEVTAQDPVATGGVKELSGCCNDIAAYAEMFAPEAKWYCSQAAGKSIPPCPFDAKPKKP